MYREKTMTNSWLYLETMETRRQWNDTFSELGLKEKPKGFDQDYTLKNNPLETKTNFISRETLEEFVGN